MADRPESAWYCVGCGTENAATSYICRACGRDWIYTPQQQRQGVAFLLNELEALRLDGQIDEEVYARLHRRYRDELAGEVAAAATTPTPPPAPRPPAPAPEGPGWLAEQQANLLLYLGAFLMVIAALTFVGYSSGTISDGVKMALLVAGTLLFLAAGFACLRYPRVQQAGVVFFGVGSLMVPLNFVGAYGFFFADDDIDATGLWLAGSLASVLFYGAVSWLGMGRWYPVPMAGAALSALGAVLVLTGAPPEAYPGSYIALAFLLAAPSLAGAGRASDTFGLVGFWSANVIVPLAVLAALAITLAADTGGSEDFFDLATRWYLPPTVALAALFYWMQAISGRRIDQSILAVVALAVSGGAAVTLVFALNAGSQWYGPAVAIVGGLYAAGSEGFGPRWFGQRHLGWMALAAITVSWLFFEGAYADFPRQGAGVHFAAAAFYLGAARLLRIELPASLRDRFADDAELYRSLAPVALIYAAGLTLGIGFFHLLSSLPAAETAQASDASLAFFGLSLGVAAVAATMRWWWPEARVHAYAIALGMSLFVLLSSVDADGQVALLLAVYTAVALALMLWEQEPLTLSVPAAYGFFALLAAWRYFEPRDEYLPLVISGIGYGLFAAFLMLRGRLARFVPAERAEQWTRTAEVAAFAYAIAAPIAGWLRLAVLADDRGFVGTDRFEETLLYQTAAASVFLLAIMAAAHWWLVQRRVEPAIVASALLMVALLLEIGHFRPESAQAYTAPLGAYLLAGAFLSQRARDLPADAQGLIGPLEALGAALIMGPSFAQSIDDGAWGYGLVLLGEGLFGVMLALVQRRVWLLGIAIGFVVADGLHYLFFAGGPALPNWAILAIAGVSVMAAGTIILLSRERWTEWQQMVRAWWTRQPAASKAG